MTDTTNTLGQPIGTSLPDWTGSITPSDQTLMANYAQRVPLNARIHDDALFAAFQADTNGAMWTYMPSGPFADRATFDTFLQSCENSRDPLFYAIINTATGLAEGFASYLRITPDVGTIEVGYIAMSPALQKTRLHNAKGLHITCSPLNFGSARTISSWRRIPRPGLVPWSLGMARRPDPVCV